METQPKKTSKSLILRQLLFSILGGALLVMVYNYVQAQGENDYYYEEDLSQEIEVHEHKFGFNTSECHIESGVIKPNQFLGQLLNQNGISNSQIAELEAKAKSVLDVKNIREGKCFHVVKKDSCNSETIAFVYEPDPLSYVVIDFNDSVQISLIDRPYETVIETAAGEISSSLWQSMSDHNINPGVIDLMEGALASSVSFYHTQKGDKYKVIYERKYIDGKPVALGKMLGAYYQNQYGEFYSVYFENDIYAGFYDMEGRPSKKSFLKSPIKGTARISSRYNLRRLHPIKGKRIPHLGTDYAAPYGTPIIAVADGVITNASYTANNGKFVKMKHDDTYETQYLHMQKFARGIKPGVQVSQGTVIGYVGSTGLATGPHVCFRFWKNGKQVDHFRENFPPSDPMPADQLPIFFEVRDKIKWQLDNIPMDSNHPIVLEQNSDLAL